MSELRILARTMFDGETAHSGGPYLITAEQGVITSVETLPDGVTAVADIRADFVMPGLVEAHAHIFLDGSLLDNDERAAYLRAYFRHMTATARANIEKCTAAGVTLVRDAGDRYGVNHAIRDWLETSAAAPIALRSPGLALKRPKRYGAFMGRDVEQAEEIPQTVDELARTSDDIKILLTGIIDFKAGEVKGAPQFDAGELRVIVTEAHARDRKTFVHCSGVAGLEVAVEAGVDSIEHGFFMTRDILARMAEKGIAWVPTFSPVHFQWLLPKFAGWNENTVENLRRILDSHAEHVAIAHELGVELVAGSDAGSQGVDHGTALIDELFHFLDAGLPMDAVLVSATSRPRRLWGAPSANIAAGNMLDLIALEGSPFDDREALRRVRHTVRGEAWQEGMPVPA